MNGRGGAHAPVRTPRKREVKGREGLTHKSAVGSRRQATEPDHFVTMPEAESARARGSTSSTTAWFRQDSCSLSFMSDRQSVRKIEPRQSPTRTSLLVDGCESTLVSGWGKAMT